MKQWLSLACVVFGVWIGCGASAEELDLESICGGQAPAGVASPGLKLLSLQNEDLILVDRGFCPVYRDSRSANPDDGRWTIRFYASHSFTHYFNSDVSFHSSRYDVTIRDYEWAERGSRDFFSPTTWAKAGNNPFQILDEPTNTFTFSIEKDGNEFFLSAFHPKFLQADHQVKQMSGTIDGTVVDRVQPVNQPFHGYNLTPGESKLVRNEFTYAQMNYEAGYGRRFVVFNSKIGNITYVPRIGVGIQMGKGYSAMVKPGAWWDYEESTGSIRYQGFGGSIGNRIEFNSKNERVGVFLDTKVAYYSMKNQFLDGTQKFNLGFLSNNVGVKFRLYHQKPRNPQPRD